MKSFESFVHSNLFEVHFAGFVGNGHDLQNKGWSFSAYQGLSGRSYGYELQLMLNHSSSGLTMCSSIELLEIDMILRCQNNQRNIPKFNVMSVIAGDGKNSYVTIPKPVDVSFNNRQFFAMDASPSFEMIDLSKIDFNKFGVFRRLNDSANLFLPEKTVNEILDELLLKQKPKQEEIIKNRRRNEFMKEFNRNPNEDIKLQLIAV